MTTGQKIAQQRKKRALTQGALAEELGVTRQAVSKWEADAALPDADKLVRLSELFGCTVDYLLKNREEDPAPSPSGGDPEGEKAGQAGGAGSLFWFPLRTFEYKSGRTLFGLPLVHVNLGWGKTAKGIVAVGFKAHGVLSVGLLSMGVFSFGVLSLGALSVGAAALGVLSIGAIAVALFLALGAAAAGFLAYGAVAVGFFSAGALAVAQYVAVGDHAIAAVPIARTYASTLQFLLSLCISLRGGAGRRLGGRPARSRGRTSLPRDRGVRAPLSAGNRGYVCRLQNLLILFCGFAPHRRAPLPGREAGPFARAAPFGLTNFCFGSIIKGNETGEGNA